MDRQERQDKLDWLDCVESLFLSYTHEDFDGELKKAAIFLLNLESSDKAFIRFSKISVTAGLSEYEKFCAMACVSAERSREVKEALQGLRISTLRRLYRNPNEGENEDSVNIDFEDKLKSLIFIVKPSKNGNVLELLAPICCYIEGNLEYVGLISEYATFLGNFDRTKSDGRLNDYFSHPSVSEGRELLLMRGGDALEMTENLGASASLYDYRVLKVDAGALWNMGDVKERVRELAGTVLITGSVLCLQQADALFENDRRLLLRMLFNHLRFIVVMSKCLTEFDLSESGCTIYRFDQLIPSALCRLQCWKDEARKLGITDEQMLIPLADRFSFTYGQIASVVESARLSPCRDKNAEESFRSLQQSAMGIIGFSMGEYAREVQGRYGWADIVISPDCKEALHNACNRVIYRTQVYDNWKMIKKPAYGNGVSMLFYGPPGTGKTMAAQVVAREVGCALYKIDLSQIMDKYVGESEKKLKEIFENASKANIMLLFDEADSLFSKRTQVGSSNDRYANTQTAFLLQQIEEYDGVSVLTTNCMGNFDEAFKRRIQYFVSFPMPSVKQRLEIWERVIPTSLERAEELNLSFIAEAFELSGSSIKAAATSAVFMAVGKGEKLSREHLRLALRDELLKQGRVYMTSDFAGYDNI